MSRDETISKYEMARFSLLDLDLDLFILHLLKEYIDTTERYFRSPNNANNVAADRAIIALEKHCKVSDKVASAHTLIAGIMGREE